jgi:uncharacterized protein with HEPN domain
MIKSNKDLRIISYILEYCTEIEETVNRFGDDYACFRSDKIYQNAIAMCILQIGETAGKFSKEVCREKL